MNLLLLILSKYILGFLLQASIFVLGIYTFSHEKADKKTFLLMLCALVPTNIIVRILPMSFGIHIFLNVATILYMTYRFCKFELYTIIRSTLITTLLVLLTEMVCFATLILFFGQVKCDAILTDPLYKAVVFVPFNLILGGVTYLYYRRMVKKYY